MGLFGKWSKKRDQREGERARDFDALLDRIEKEHFRREKTASGEEPTQDKETE